MEDWQKLDKEKRDLVEDLEKELSKRIDGLQNSVWVKLLELLPSLKTTQGALRNTVVNIKAAQDRVEDIFSKLTKEVRTGLIVWMSKQIRKILNSNLKYIRLFSTISNTFKKALERSIFKSLGFNLKTNKVVAKGFLARITNFTEVKNNVSKFFEDGISGLSVFSTFKDRLKNFFTGGDKRQGLIKRIFGGATDTVFITTSRAAQRRLAKKAGLKYFLYVGKAIKNTRKFCYQRFGKIFTEDVVDSWNELVWVGKILNSSVWESLGGHNCIHHLQALTEKLALRLAKTRGGINTLRPLPQIKKAA